MFAYTGGKAWVRSKEEDSCLYIGAQDGHGEVARICFEGTGYI